MSEQLKKDRYSCRAFTDELLSDDLLECCLKEAGKAPSSKNTQPWKVIWVKGATLERLKKMSLEAFDQNQIPNPEYQYGPEPMTQDMRDEAKKVGIALFKHKGIGKEDKEKVHFHYRENFGFFGAPQVAFLTLPKESEKGTFLDGGLFLRGLVDSLNENGWNSCPMFSAVSFPEVLHRELSVNEDEIFVCGIAIGKEKESLVNEFRSERKAVKDYLKILD